VLFGGTVSGSIVLDAIAEKSKRLYEVLSSFSLSQTNFTTLAKTAQFPPFFAVEWPKRGGRRTFSGWLPVDKLHLVRY